VIDQTDQANRTANIRKQDELMAITLTQMAGSGRKCDPLGLFSIAWFNLAHEIVAAANHGLKDLPSARVLGTIEGLDRPLGHAALTNVPL
jgi:hypothetical protein